MTDDTDRGIRQFAWAHDGRHLLYLQDTGGDENWRLHDVDLPTMERRDLTPFEGVQTELIATEREFPDEILVGLNKDNPQLHDVYRLDLKTGELGKELVNPGLIGMLADAQLVVRAGLRPQPDGSMSLVVRDSAAGDVARAAGDPGRGLADHGPGRVQRRRRLHAAGVLGGRAGGPADPDRPRYRRHRGAGRGSGGGRQRRQDEPGHPRAADRHRSQGEVGVPGAGPVSGQAPGPRSALCNPATRCSLTPTTRTGSGWCRSPTTPARSRSTPTTPPPAPAVSCSSISRSCPEYELARKEPFSYQSRDGLTINGYLTFPPGRDRTDLPTVLLVHGGPWARDTWGFDPQAQWLANRGYLCIQVNFRGSSGYGKAFLNAGDREWGANMQDDLSDAVAYAISQGWTDPARSRDPRRLVRRVRGAGRRRVHS